MHPHRGVNSLMIIILNMIVIGRDATSNGSTHGLPCVSVPFHGGIRVWRRLLKFLAKTE